MLYDEISYEFEEIDCQKLEDIFSKSDYSIINNITNNFPPDYQKCSTLTTLEENKYLAYRDEVKKII